MELGRRRKKKGRYSILRYSSNENQPFFPQPWYSKDSRPFRKDFREEISTSAGLVLLVISSWKRWFLNTLEEAIPQFNSRAVLQLTEGAVTIMLPSVDQDLRVVWSLKEGGLGTSCDSSRPIVVVISDSTRQIERDIKNHYPDQDHSRWDRLEQNQTWVYLDLYFLFTKWDLVWSEAKSKLDSRTAHRFTNQNAAESSAPDTFLNMRLEDAYNLLEYYNVTATGLLEQQENLLSLAFNPETAFQGMAVARLNVLAFIYLPLGFFAIISNMIYSVFGITTFTVEPKHYPAAAIPALIVTLSAAYITHRLLVARNSEPLPPHDTSTFNDPSRVSREAVGVPISANEPSDEVDANPGPAPESSNPFGVPSVDNIRNPPPPRPLPVRWRNNGKRLDVRRPVLNLSPKPVKEAKDEKTGKGQQ
ncbi:hypothetical protein DL95DRAFT_416400 [Leptodontidium sp. 2 PMI_412]|nr:hypothetical protein DL95DRAFT_416400 [Leptodontidium sp. 2 PMI_412]